MLCLCDVSKLESGHKSRGLEHLTQIPSGLWSASSQDMLFGGATIFNRPRTGADVKGIPKAATTRDSLRSLHFRKLPLFAQPMRIADHGR